MGASVGAAGVHQVGASAAEEAHQVGASAAEAFGGHQVGASAAVGGHHAPALGAVGAAGPAVVPHRKTFAVVGAPVVACGAAWMCKFAAFGAF